MNFYGIEIDYDLYKHFLEFLTDSEIDAMFKALTTPPPRYYLRVNTAKTSPGELVKRLSERGISVYRDEHLEEAIWMPVLGPFKIPTARKVVIVDKKAAESVMMGADLYAPGVVKTDYVKRGEEVNIMSDRGHLVAFGTAVVESSEVMKTRTGLYVTVEKSLYKTPKIRNLPEYSEGLFYSQSLPAMVVGHVVRKLDVKRALDLNAAPGGKTTHLAQYGIAVIAVDRSWEKIGKLKSEISRMGLGALVDVVLHDSRYIERDFPRVKTDVALVDPPCTDIGVRPKIYHHVTLKSAKSLAKYQWQFLKTALKISKYVVYSTCTLTHIENESVLKNVDVEPIDVKMGAPGWGCDQCRRFFPHIHHTPGFFLALVKRRQ